MTRIWLVVNPASGSYDAAVVEAVRDAAVAAGGTVDRLINFPDDDLPTAAALDAAGVEVLAIMTGDGTINSACATLGIWGGRVLVLPGGTMNLLSRRLHGDDAEPAAVVAAALAQPDRTQPVTVLVSDDEQLDITGLVGAFVGPTTAWGDVREHLRRRNIGALVEATTNAIRETFGGNMVRIAGDTRAYPAIYAEPVDGRLNLMGFSADGVSDLFSHGFAWAGGDFRTGPHDELGAVEAVTIEADAGRVGLLVDGERGEAPVPLTLRAERSPLRFVATHGTAPPA